jgi:hypothetical protein
MRAGVYQGVIISQVLFSLHVNDMLSRHVDKVLYADDTAVIATSRQPALLVKYLEAYLSDLEENDGKLNHINDVLQALR